MKSSPAARAAFVVLGGLFMFMSAVPAYASHSTDEWSRYFTNASSSPWRTRNLPSAARSALTDLENQSVAGQIPVPVLLGVSLSSITPNFRDPRDGGARLHEGEDIMAPKGAYIVSPTDAVVTSIGSGAGAGNYVYTANPGGETFRYMHLDRFAAGLAVGDVLKPGDLIGYVGNTGNAAGGAAHLHFEIRNGSGATDPYPRLGRVFTTEERLAAVTKALEKAQDPAADATLLASLYRSTFLSAQAQGTQLPSVLSTALGLKLVSTPVLAAGSYTRDLTLGSRGDDVTALQNFLVSAHAGTAATALAEAGATGYFGNMTRAALAEYQASVGISPAVGYFGPLTRSYISSLK